MAHSELQAQRFENKYLVDNATALAVREFVRAYLELDEFSEAMADLSYPVHSLYLDSPDLKLYHSTLNGDKNRYKLRIRYYDDNTGSPTFFEIKSRCNNTISKQRGMVRRDAVATLLAGHLPEEGHLLSHRPGDLQAVRRFCRMVNDLGAYAVAHVAYLREAWVSPHDNSVRVTLDREVLCDLDPTTNLFVGMTRPCCVFGKLVVLELKFTNRFPDWFGDLVRIFNLVQCGAAKYAEGVIGLDVDRVMAEAHMAHTSQLNPGFQDPSILLSKGRSPFRICDMCDDIVP